MSDLDALLAGIVADPHSEVRWLVLADWLDDNDQPERAELLRVHRELLRTCTNPDVYPERTALHNRMMDLLRAGVRPCVPQQTMELPGGVKMQFSFIPPGSFLMGSDKGDDDEKPVHEVRLTQGFWLGTTPVTQEQWEAVMATNPSFFHFNGPQLPVEGVSWEDAVAFCNQVRQQCGIELRLPTEAEWEYACRAGTTTEYFSDVGEDALKELAWFDKNAGDSTHPVGQLLPNGWGLHDLHGNVWEWCEDWYGVSYYAQSPKDDPQGPPSGSVRVLRGGGWCNSAEDCRAASRFRSSPTRSISDLGFRLARVPSGGR